MTVELRGTYCNTKPQVEALEALLRKLPDPSPPADRPKPGRARQLDAFHLYNLGWSLARVGEHLGVDHTTVLTKLRERGIPPATPTDDHDREVHCSCLDVEGHARGHG
ncbi:hypothetical protein [Amycolatopsis orientalis]|uniref:hypothetical protein n=1 Tax=Amycolatopsis orientalis TaxID=31958 RepID=UPI000A456C99|nr:hypothetical protein [Amycolatopsis orientalis]